MDFKHIELHQYFNPKNYVCKASLTNFFMSNSCCLLFFYSLQVVHLVTSEFFHQGDMEREKLQVEPQVVTSKILLALSHYIGLCREIIIQGASLSF